MRLGFRRNFVSVLHPRQANVDSHHTLTHKYRSINAIYVGLRPVNDRSNCVLQSSNVYLLFFIFTLINIICPYASCQSVSGVFTDVKLASFTKHSQSIKPWRHTVTWLNLRGRVNYWLTTDCCLMEKGGGCWWFVLYSIAVVFFTL